MLIMRPINSSLRESCKWSKNSPIKKWHPCLQVLPRPTLEMDTQKYCKFSIPPLLDHLLSSAPPPNLESHASVPIPTFQHLPNSINLPSVFLVRMWTRLSQQKDALQLRSLDLPRIVLSRRSKRHHLVTSKSQNSKIQELPSPSNFPSQQPPPSQRPSLCSLMRQMLDVTPVKAQTVPVHPI